MIILMRVTISIFFLLGFCQSDAKADSLAGLERVTQKLVFPPLLPKHDQIAKSKLKIVQVRMVIEEKELKISDGVFVQAMTFNGTVPGPIIVVHEGDYIELTLVNPSTNVLLHNIDFHAATGALGGGVLTRIHPGEEVVLRFKATKPGVFVYHCAPGGIMVPYHVVMGMNGAIMVLPRDGLKDANGQGLKYDRAYYIGEQDFYIPRDIRGEGSYKRFTSPVEAMGDTLAIMQMITPSHLVFNGAVGALAGESAMRAIVGEKVLFIHAQANRDSRPHLIGGHGDLVWEGGSFNDTPKTNLETWFVPGGAAVAMLYEFKQAGTYAYVNHNLIEAFLLGAVAHVKVEGKWDDDLMKQVQKPYPIKDSSGLNQ